MKRLLTEQQVLNKLQIDDFRHISKDKVIQLCSILDKMDPEVAKKALEQFPEYAEMMTEMVTQYRLALDKIFEENKNSTAAFYMACQENLNSLQKRLDSEELDFEQRNEISEKMLEAARMIGKKDSENKAFLWKIAAGVFTTIAMCCIASVTVIGAGGMIGQSAD